MKDGIFSFQLKQNYFCRKLTDDARYKNVPRPLDLTKTLKSYHKRNDKRKFPGKYKCRYYVSWIAWVNCLKMAKHFSVNSGRKFISLHEASRRAAEQTSGFLPSDRYFSFFWVVISVMYVGLFIVGKFLLFVYHSKIFRRHVSCSIS